MTCYCNVVSTSHRIFLHFYTESPGGNGLEGLGRGGNVFSSSIADVMRSFVQLCSSSSQCFPWMMDELLSSETSSKTNLNNSIKHEPCTPWKHLKTHIETQEKWIHGHMIHMILLFPIKILPPKPLGSSMIFGPGISLSPFWPFWLQRHGGTGAPWRLLRVFAPHPTAHTLRAPLVSPLPATAEAAAVPLLPPLGWYQLVI